MSRQADELDYDCDQYPPVVRSTERRRDRGNRFREIQERTRRLSVGFLVVGGLGRVNSFVDLRDGHPCGES